MSRSDNKNQGVCCKLAQQKSVGHPTDGGLDFNLTCRDSNLSLESLFGTCKQLLRVCTDEKLCFYDGFVVVFYSFVAQSLQKHFIVPPLVVSQHRNDSKILYN